MPSAAEKSRGQSLPFAFYPIVDAQQHRLVWDAAGTEPERKESQYTRLYFKVGKFRQAKGEL